MKTARALISFLAAASAGASAPGSLPHGGPSLTVCGNFKYRRTKRDCAAQSELEHFKNCSRAERTEPLYLASERPLFQCLDSRSPQGRDAIRGILEGRDCRARRVSDFRRNILPHPRFREAVRRIERALGVRARVGHTFDLVGQTSAIELLLEGRDGGPRGRITLASAKGPGGACRPLARPEVLKTLRISRPPWRSARVPAPGRPPGRPLANPRG